MAAHGGWTPLLARVNGDLSLTALIADNSAMSATDALFCTVAIVATLGAIGSAIFAAVRVQVGGSARHRAVVIVGAGVQIALLLTAPALAWLALRSSLQKFGTESAAIHMVRPIPVACGLLALALLAANLVTGLALGRGE